MCEVPLPLCMCPSCQRENLALTETALFVEEVALTVVLATCALLAVWYCYFV